MIRGGNATIYVSDMDRAVRFYMQDLGLNLLFQAGHHWAQLDAGGGLQIGLHPKTDQSPIPGTPGAITVGFLVDEPIDRVVATLKQRGVVFHGPVIDDAKGTIRLAFFSDPDGNPLYLCESTQFAKQASSRPG